MSRINTATAATHPCSRCAGHPGVGIYTWGGTVNGMPVHAGTCFRCQGTGRDPGARQTRQPRHTAPNAIVAPNHSRQPTGDLLRVSENYEVVITVAGARFRATLVAAPVGTGPADATSTKGQREAGANLAAKLKGMGYKGTVKIVSWAR